MKTDFYLCRCGGKYSKVGMTKNFQCSKCHKFIDEMELFKELSIFKTVA